MSLSRLLTGLADPVTFGHRVDVTGWWLATRPYSDMVLPGDRDRLVPCFLISAPSRHPDSDCLLWLKEQGEKRRGVRRQEREEGPRSGLRADSCPFPV